LRDCSRAKEAWREAQAACPDQSYSRDYACGFKAGFRDYLDAGGSGDPPAVPPFRYRLSDYDSPGGHQAVEDWYAGFRHGSTAARASGFRELNLVPLSAPPVDAVAHEQNRIAPGAGPVGLSFNPSAPPGIGLPPSEVGPDQLPPPRVVLPPAPLPAPGGPES
jgi:hypothetical protein